MPLARQPRDRDQTGKLVAFSQPHALLTAKYTKSEPPKHFDVHKFVERLDGVSFLAGRKRKPFEYEREVRIVRLVEGINIGPGPISSLGSLAGPPGIEMSWDLERQIDKILIHPQADKAFIDVVRVQTTAPTLVDHLQHSRMAAPPL